MGNEPNQDGGKKKKNINEEEKPKPCCDCCCDDGGKKALPAHLRDPEAFFGQRECTDCCFWIIYPVFVIGWIVIISLAAATGDPSRIIRPENFRGEICGDRALVAVPAFFVPLPSRPKYGFCVKDCPGVGDIVCNNDLETAVENTTIKRFNHEYSMTAADFAAGAKAAITCKLSCDAAEKKKADAYIATQLKTQQKKCFPAFYPSGASLLRCIPGKGKGEVNQTLSTLANETATTISGLADTMGIGSFFQLGFAEVLQTWRVILISVFTCMGIALIWVYLLKWILAPIVYFCIFLVLAVLIGLGIVFMLLAEDLEAGALPGEKGTDDQAKIWRALEYLCFLLAAIYVAVMLNMMQRIRIALAVMKEASKCFTASPSLGIVPICTFIVFVGWIAFFIATSIYIQTMGSEAQDIFRTQAESTLGTAVNVSALLAEQANSSIKELTGVNETSPAFNMTQWTTLPETKVLHLYNFFMVLWTGNICIMFGFMIMAMVATHWYFSATQTQLAMYEAYEEQGKSGDDEIQKAFEDDVTAELTAQGIDDPKTIEAELAKRKEFKPKKEKETVGFPVGRATWATFANHFGTIMFGSLLIAIIQFIRAIFTYLADKYLKDNEMAKDSWIAKAVIYCIECCLWYIEQVIKIISMNAFIVTAIKNTSFCVSAFTALKLLISNMGRLAILTMLSTATMFIIKIFIVGSNFFIAYGLLTSQALTDDRKVDSGLFPLCLILLLSYVIGSLFLNVYEACVDTIFMCFLIDEDELDGEFMPKALAGIVDMFTSAEDARRAYEKQVNQSLSVDSEPKKPSTK